ncbi:MAG: sugar kinase [Dehalococcoidia bacterium]|nr:sugar kinase [Dehalococcoidia bacterium]
MYDVVSMGESMVAFEAQSYGPLREAEDFKKWVGGAADNFIITVARLGFSTGWFSRLGDDELGKFILRWIRGEGVDVSRAKIDSTKPTGLFLVEHRSTESNFRCYFYRSNSAATNLCPDDVDEEYVSQAKVVYPEGILLYASQSARHAVERLFDVAVRYDRIIIFDPNLRLTMMSAEEARSMVIPLMQKATYVLPGADELMKIMDKPDIDSAIARAHSMGITNIIVKAGAGGALLAIHGQETRHMPGFALQKTVSPMGAGDCFVGGFTAGLLKEQPLETCVRWGNAVGAFCTMAYGPFHSCPTMTELQAFLAGKEEVSR